MLTIRPSIPHTQKNCMIPHQLIALLSSYSAKQPAHSRSLWNMLLAALITIYIGGCASLGNQSSSQPITDQTHHSDAVITEAMQAEATPSSNRPFETDTLFNLLVGELSVYNGDIETAAKNYYREALNTQDPQVVARAARLARYLRDANAAIEMAELWHEVDPSNPKASENLADMLARTNQPLRALQILERQLDAGEAAEFGVLRNSNLPTGSAQLREVLMQLERLSDQDRSENFSLLLTYTLLLQKNGDHENALAQIQRLRNFDGDPVQLAIIESQLQTELGQHQAAAKVLRKALKKRPDERSLKIAYARKLTQTNLVLAEKIFAELLQDTPSDTTLLKPHSLIAAENNNFLAAKKSLQTLLDNNRETSFAWFNLGLIAAAEKDTDAALNFYEQVQPGDYYLSAVQKTVALLAAQGQLHGARSYLAALRQKHPQQAPLFWNAEAEILSDSGELVDAHSVLSEAIEQYPDQIALRLERSFLSEQLDDIGLVEVDLRHVLAIDPQNIIALNALGYVLADRTNRYNEALDLIEKALALKPDDAAIMDSLGWVQFHMGRLDAAEKNLQKAYKKFSDDEIAAHLIELYWTSGQPKKAAKIYKSIHKSTPDHPKVDRTLLRLNIPFK